MALISIFLLSTLLILINFEPLRMTGALLSICYLPGLCVFALVKRGRLLYEDLVLAFPFSIGISSLVTLLLLFSGVHVDFIPLIIHITGGIAVAAFLTAKKKNRAYTYVDVTRQELLFTIFALFVTLSLSIPFFYGLNRMGIAGHALHHSVLTTEILNGIFPPENPGLGGSAIGYYWGFHGLIAAITSRTELHPLQTIFVINVMSFFVVFCTAYSFSRSFDLPETYCYIFPVAVIALMRLDTGILFLFKAVSGNLAPLSKFSSPVIEPYDVMDNWFRELPRFDTRMLFLRKFYNVSGMPLAVSLCYSYVLMLRLVLRKKTADNNVYFIGTGLVIAACFLNYPPLAIFLLVHAPLWTYYIFQSGSGGFKDRAREAMKVGVPYILALAAVTPYILLVMAGRDVSSSGQGGVISIDFYSQSIANIIAFLVPAPVIISGIWIVSKRLSFSREWFFLLIGTVVCICLSFFTRWPFNNSYKFNYMLTFFFAFFFIMALSTWLPLISRNLMKLFVTACTVFVLFLNPILMEASYIVPYLFVKYKYSFSGRHLIYANVKTKNEAYEWIRDNTPHNALLMLSYVETNWPCCGFNNNYEMAAITERTLYVIKDEDYTVSNPEYEKRVLFREKLFEDPEDAGVVEFFTSLNRPVYLLVEDNLEEQRFIVQERFKKYPWSSGKRFVRVFHNESQSVYLIDIR